MKSKSRMKNSIRNIVTGVGGNAIHLILGFVSRTIFIRCLATEYLGINGLFTNILSILSLAELGVGNAIIYALYKPIADDDKTHIKVLMNFYKNIYRIIGLFIAIVGLCLLPFINIIISDAPNVKESLYVIYLFYLFNTVITYFYSYKSSIIIADQQNYIVSIIQYGCYIFQSIIQIVVLLLTKNFIFYLVIQSIFTFFNNFLISKMADKLYPFLKDKRVGTLQKREKKSLIKNIKALMIIKISGVLVNNTDNIIISYFSGLVSIGLVSNYNLLINTINSALTQVFNGLTGSVGNLNAQESIKKKKEVFEAMNLMNFWIFGLASIGIILVSNDIIRVWLGEKYVLSIDIIIALTLNFYMLGVQNSVNTFKNTMGLFVYGKYILLFTAGINLVLSFILGEVWGLFGIFIATAISRLLTNVWYHPLILYKYGFRSSFIRYVSRYVLYILILMVSIGVTGFLCSKILFAPIYTLILKVFICLVVPNIIFTICFYKTKEFIYIKEAILRRFR